MEFRSDIMHAVQENEFKRGKADYLSPAELAIQLGVRVETVYTCRHRLKIKADAPPDIKINPPGGLNPFARQRRSHEWGPSQKFIPDSTEDLIQALNAEGVIGPLDRLKVLSRLVRTGAPLIKINAIKALEELSKQSEGRVGPPTPKTEEEVISRFVRLFLFFPAEIIDKAYAIAFPELPQGEPSKTLPDDPRNLSNPMGGPGGPVLDLSEPT